MPGVYTSRRPVLPKKCGRNSSSARMWENGGRADHCRMKQEAKHRFRISSGSLKACKPQLIPAIPRLITCQILHDSRSGSSPRQHFAATWRRHDPACGARVRSTPERKPRVPGTPELAAIEAATVATNGPGSPQASLVGWGSGSPACGTGGRTARAGKHSALREFPHEKCHAPANGPSSRAHLPGIWRTSGALGAGLTRPVQMASGLRSLIVTHSPERTTALTRAPPPRRHGPVQMPFFENTL